MVTKSSSLKQIGTQEITIINMKTNYIMLQSVIKNRLL